jgi:hypothetical protein
MAEKGLQRRIIRTRGEGRQYRSPPDPARLPQSSAVVIIQKEGDEPGLGKPDTPSEWNQLSIRYTIC